MSLLELVGVHKRYADGSGERSVLREVSLRVEQGELVVVWGLRRSGRSTLLRVAAGIEAPDSGVVRFDGHDLAGHGERLLGAGIGYCQRTLRFADGQTALDHAMVGLLSRWVSPASARSRALQALERAGVATCAGMTQRELSSAEAVRVALARTLTLEPRLILIDEPVKGVELIERDPILSLLRSLADEGVAVLTSTGESTGLSEADRGLMLGDGELRGAPAADPVTVLPLRRGGERRAHG
ncbi:MAG TPA: ATP-binding cassette domain-containing protein [Solirubrobacteraceae bacterium]|jgi:ABC-type multidrug transport system ATPase subunit|nr:ATP-binding cassette domain-containing protein [Solirubrobacteraceae bacterium]